MAPAAWFLQNSPRVSRLAEVKEVVKSDLWNVIAQQSFSKKEEVQIQIVRTADPNLPLNNRHKNKPVSYLHRRLGWFLERLLRRCLDQGPDIPEASFRFVKKVVDELGWKRQLPTKTSILKQ